MNQVKSTSEPANWFWKGLPVKVQPFSRCVILRIHVLCQQTIHVSRLVASKQCTLHCCLAMYLHKGGRKELIFGKLRICGIIVDLASLGQCTTDVQCREV